MRFSIRDLLWAMAVVAVVCLLLVQRQRFLNHTAGLYDRIEELREELRMQAQQPRSVTIGEVEYQVPLNMRRAIVDFPLDGGVSVRFETMPTDGEKPD